MLNNERAAKRRQAISAAREEFLTNYQIIGERPGGTPLYERVPTGPEDDEWFEEKLNSTFIIISACKKLGIKLPWIEVGDLLSGVPWECVTYHILLQTMCKKFKQAIKEAECELGLSKNKDTE